MNRQQAIELIRSDIADEPPEGFKRLPQGSGFNQYFGPVYGKLVDGKLRLGMRVGHRHMNPHGTCHGGILASFADMQIFVTEHQERDLADTVKPTINLSIDLISPAVLGDWLESRTELLKATKSVLFLSTIASVDDRIIFRSSGIYKISKKEAPAGSTLGALFSDIE